MSLIEIMANSVADSEANEKTIFEAAMAQHLKEGKQLRLMDIAFDVYKCQRALGQVYREIVALNERLDEMAAKKASPKKPSKKASKR